MKATYRVVGKMGSSHIARYSVTGKLTSGFASSIASPIVKEWRDSVEKMFPPEPGDPRPKPTRITIIITL